MEFEYNQIHFMTKLGKRHNLYYKRMSKEAKLAKDTSLYKLINSKKSDNKEEKEEFPYCRSLLIISFDKDIKEGDVKEVFRCLGKIRSLQKGVSRGKGGRSFTFFVLVYKFEKDLKKAFNREYFQYYINEKLKGKLRGIQRSEDYLQELFQNSSVALDEGPQEDEDGFFAIEEDGIEEDKERFVTRKRKKKDTVKSDFYKFQVTKSSAKANDNLELEEDGVDATRKRIKQEFERDIDRLNEIRLKKSMES